MDSIMLVDVKGIWDGESPLKNNWGNPLGSDILHCFDIKRSDCMCMVTDMAFHFLFALGGID